MPVRETDFVLVQNDLHPCSAVAAVEMRSGKLSEQTRRLDTELRALLRNHEVHRVSHRVYSRRLLEICRHEYCLASTLKCRPWRHNRPTLS